MLKPGFDGLDLTLVIGIVIAVFRVGRK